MKYVFMFAFLLCAVSALGQSNLKKYVRKYPSELFKRKPQIRNEVIFPDFENYKYPQFCVEGDNTSFLLKDGEFKDKGDDFLFAGVKYADVTGDNNDEAIVVLDTVSGGSSMPRCVYIFETDNNLH